MKAFKNTVVKLYSVLFTASHKPPARQQTFTDRDVRTFHREDVPELIELINKGQEARFIDAIISPSWSGFGFNT